MPSGSVNGGSGKKPGGAKSAKAISAAAKKSGGGGRGLPKQRQIPWMVIGGVAVVAVLIAVIAVSIVEVPGSAAAGGVDAVRVESGSVDRARGHRHSRLSRRAAHRFDATRRLRPDPPAVRWPARRDLGHVHGHRLSRSDPHGERGAFARARCGVDHLQSGSRRRRGNRHAHREGRRQVLHHDVPPVPGPDLADLAAVLGGSSARGRFRRRRADRPVHRLAAPEQVRVPGGRCELRDDPSSYDPANPPPFDPSDPGANAVAMDGGTLDASEVQTDMQAPAGSGR